MNFENPTPLQLGMTGSFAGQRYRVDGRLVMAMDMAGETYRWNEFHLVTTDGSSATLVHEDGEEGPEWRLFTLIEPENPITATEAARVRVGDVVQLTARPARVTLVDESRIEFIEGQPPEGAEVGDVARYFNAETETDSELIVVSWTGDEVEFYRGMNLPEAAVAAGFRIATPRLRPAPAPASGTFSSSLPEIPHFASPGRWFRTIAGLLVTGVMLLLGTRACIPSRRARGTAVARLHAPEAPLKTGAAGTFGGQRLTVVGHAVVEIAEVHRFHERHEYVLEDEQHRGLLLVCGMEPNSPDWFLLTPASGDGAPDARQAAALRQGDHVTLEGTSAPVTRLFRCFTRQTDLQPPALPFGAASYGFAAVAGNQAFLARWDETSIRYHRGVKVSAASLRAAFADHPSR